MLPAAAGLPFEFGVGGDASPEGFPFRLRAADACEMVAEEAGPIGQADAFAMVEADVESGQGLDIEFGVGGSASAQPVEVHQEGAGRFS